MTTKILPFKRMTAAQAITFLTAHPERRVQYTARNPGRPYERVVCRLEDGELVQPHPTDPQRGPIEAPARGVRYTVVPTESEQAALDELDEQQRLAADRESMASFYGEAS